MIRRTKEESNKFITNPGSRFYQKRHGEVQPDGTILLVNDEVIDIQEKMNAEYPATTIDNILANCLPGTDFSDPGAGFTDFTQAPKTLAEFMQIQINMKNKFDSLPAEYRQKFDNDLNKFMATAGSEEWMSKLGIEIKSTDIPVEPIKDDEKEVKE